MCLLSTKRSFCFCFKLRTGAKLVIFIDFIMVVEIIIVYLSFMMMGEQGFSKIIDLFSQRKLSNQEKHKAFQIVWTMLITGWIICGLGLYKAYIGVKMWIDGFQRKDTEYYFSISVSFYFTLLIYALVAISVYQNFLTSVLYTFLVIALISECFCFT